MAQGLDPKILNRLPDIAKAAIVELAEDIGANSYLRLAVIHVSLCLERASNDEPGSSGRSRTPAISSRTLTGLRRAEQDLLTIVEDLARELGWPELSSLKRYIDYPQLHRIVLGQYQVPQHAKDAKQYFTFLAILLLYIYSRGQVEQGIRRRPAYDAFGLFNIDDHIDRLFPADVTVTSLPYEFPKPTGRIASISELLAKEFGIENPVDPGIATHFGIKSSAAPPPDRYLCYRETTKWISGARDKSEITKSFLELFPPRGEKTTYWFRHTYQDTHGTFRKTNGFIVKLAQTFYFIGGSIRGERQTAEGIKVIAIPSSEECTWHNHDFICGLFLSNDATLKPITGRILLVRAREAEESIESAFCGRISKANLIKDIKANALRPSELKSIETEELLRSIRNTGRVGKLDTVIASFSRR